MVPIARLEKRSGCVHAVRPDMENTYCKLTHDFVITGYVDDVSQVNCDVCQRALKKEQTRCSDCGKPGSGNPCPACRVYHKRTGRRRGGERKPTYCEFDPDELAALYRRYRKESVSMLALSKEVGVSTHTLKARFRDAGYRVRGRMTAAKARAKRSAIISKNMNFPQHPQAKDRAYYVSRAEDSLLTAVWYAAIEGETPALAELAANCEYKSEQGVWSALARLRKRGFIKGTKKSGMTLTSLALRREVRAGPIERMADVYVSGMNSCDLSRAAGVANVTALKFIKAQIQLIPA